MKACWKGLKEDEGQPQTQPTQTPALSDARGPNTTASSKHFRVGAEGTKKDLYQLRAGLWSVH